MIEKEFKIIIESAEEIKIKLRDLMDIFCTGIIEITKISIEEKITEK